MKKLYRNIIAFIALITFSFAAPVSAATASTTTSSGTVQASDLFSGQRHSYSVIFRGNGEALTFAKVVFTNTAETDMTKFDFEVPRVKPTEIEIYQMELKRRCITFLSGNNCQQYEEGDYDNSYYYSYYGNDNQATYSKVSGKNLTQEGSKFSVKLPVAVGPNKTSSLVIAYAAKGYVTESLGLFKFDFETIKVPARIKELKVAIDVDSDLILKGKNANVNYNSGGEKVAITAASAQDSFSSGRLDNIIGSIGRYTQLTKTASNLSKNETFNVRGEYSTSWFRLYLGSIVTTVLIIAAIIFGIILLSKYMGKRNNRKKEAEMLESPLGEDTSTNEIKLQTASDGAKITDGKINIPRVAICGLISAVATLVIFYAMQLINDSNILYQIGGYNNGISALFGLIGILLLLASTFGPAIAASVKCGWKYVMPIILFEILWIVVFVILLAVLYNTGHTTIFQYGPDIVSD